MAAGPGSTDHLVVMGLMGAGKSTIAEALSQRLGRPWRDSDHDIESATGRTGREIAASEGVEALHQREEAVLLDALGQPEPLVIAAAGWVVESDRCRTALASATVIFLEVGVGELRRRMNTGGHRRTLSPAELDQLVASRTPLFLQVADLMIDADGRPEAIVDTIVAALDRP